MEVTRITHSFLTLSVFVAAIYLLTAGSSWAEKSEFAKAAELVRQKQFVKAFTIFEHLAMAHDPDAQFNTATMLRKGIGRPSNYTAALKWAWLAELGGHERSIELRQELINLIPEEHVDLVRNGVRTILQARMDAGESAVILQMADYHLFVEAEPDYKNAYALRSLAAALSIKNAINLRDEVETELAPEDLIEAQTIAEKLFSSVNWASVTDR